MGININCSERDFVALILDGRKWIETRATPSLRPYVGRRVGLIRTGCGPATLCGYVRVVGETFAESWGPGAMVDGTSYQRPGFGYVLGDVKRC